jgi:hypothetical protein
VSAPCPKLRAGAYLTDGNDLYEVTYVRRLGPGVKVVIEDCKTFIAQQLDMTSLRNFRLVRGENP